METQKFVRREFEELGYVRNRLTFLGDPLNNQMDDGVRIEHRDMALRVVDQLEKKILNLVTLNHETELASL
jgi:hypothetical protein